MHGFRPRILEPGELFADRLGVRLDEQGMRRKRSDVREVGPGGETLDRRAAALEGALRRRQGVLRVEREREEPVHPARGELAHDVLHERARARHGRPHDGFAALGSQDPLDSRGLVLGEPADRRAAADRGVQRLRRLPASQSDRAGDGLAHEAPAGCAARRDPRRGGRGSPERPRGSQARRAGGREPPAAPRVRASGRTPASRRAGRDTRRRASPGSGGRRGRAPWPGSPGHRS